MADLQVAAAAGYSRLNFAPRKFSPITDIGNVGFPREWRLDPDFNGRPVFGLLPFPVWCRRTGRWESYCLSELNERATPNAEREKLERTESFRDGQWREWFPTGSSAEDGILGSLISLGPFVFFRDSCGSFTSLEMGKNIRLSMWTSVCGWFQLI